ncbi:hypothetical protein ACWEQL_22670 [Kitasatospora sp. NPDC004240]
MTQSSRRSVRARKARAWTAGAVVVAAAAGFGAYRVAERWHDPYPVAHPVATAQRLDARTQAVYDALALPQARLDSEGPRKVLYSGVNDCHPRGLAYAFDLRAQPPGEERTVTINESWALAGVGRPQALEAMQRARRTLTAAGWSVTSFADNEVELTLRMTPPATAPGVSEKIVVTHTPGDRLAVSAHAGCAKMPDNVGTNQWGEPALPTPTAPAQLRPATEDGARG